MDFKEFMNLVYVKGYFCKKEQFARKLIEGSVQEPGTISGSDALIKSYLRGDSIRSLAQMMMDAGLRAEKISAFIEGLYNTEHKRTPTYKERYHGQTYKEALYDKFKKTHPDVNMDDMTDFLAKQLYELIKNEYDASTSQAQPQSPFKCGASTQAKLHELILQMIFLSGRLDQDRQCIAEWLKRQPISMPYSACPRWKPFHDAFEELQKCNAELKAISEAVKWNTPSSATAILEKIDAQSLALSCSERFRDLYNVTDRFNCYREKLNEIMAQLEK